MTNVLSSFALIAATMPLRAISERHRPSHRRGLVATLRSNDFSPETIRTKFSKEKAVNDENLRRVNFRKRSHMIGLAKVFCSVTRDGNSSSKEGVDRCSPAESTDDNWLLRQETFSNIDWDEPFLATVSFGSEVSEEDAWQDLVGNGSPDNVRGFKDPCVRPESSGIDRIVVFDKRAFPRLRRDRVQY